MMLVEIIWILKDMKAGQPCMQGEGPETQIEDEDPQVSGGIQITRIQAQAAVKKKLTRSEAVRRGLKRILAVYYEQNVTTERFEDFDGERWIVPED